MIKLENFEVMGWEHAIRGMRNPMNSWEKGDSFTCDEPYKCQRGRNCALCIGPNDHKLMMNLRNAGTDHRKFMRMITVYVDITAPLYWWKEFDTYKISTVANSCSTMHKIADKEFTYDDFSHEHLIDDREECWSEGIMTGAECMATPFDIFDEIVGGLNAYRSKYLEYKNKPMKDEAKRKSLMKKYWWQMIQLLPSSYNQKRTVMLNYEVLANMYKSRKAHKLDEWVEFCKWIERLPYSEIITGNFEEGEMK